MRDHWFFEAYKEIIIIGTVKLHVCTVDIFNRKVMLLMLTPRPGGYEYHISIKTAVHQSIHTQQENLTN